MNKTELVAHVTGQLSLTRRASEAIECVQGTGVRPPR